MSCERVFLDPRGPALPAAVDWLCRRYGRPGSLDLRPAIVAVPTGFAAWRLRELLLDRVEREGLIFVPPAIVTPSGLPELLYDPQRPFAPELTQALAWARVLQTTKQNVRSVFHGTLPRDTADPRWIDLGRLLARQHRELAGHGLDFAAVVREFESWEGYQESGRWQVLSALQAEYHALLDSLELWDVQTARLVAVRQKECRTERDLVLVGTTDLNEALRAMLAQTAQQSPERRIVSLVHASPEWSERFDEYGSVVSAAWVDEFVELGQTQVLVADQPLDQAAAVAEALAGLGGEYRADQISVCVTDSRLEAGIDRTLIASGVPIAPSWSDANGLLKAVEDHLRSPRFSTEAALIRHAAVADVISSSGCNTRWLVELDQYFNEHLPTSLPKREDQWLCSVDKYWALKKAVREFHKLIRPLSSRVVRPLTEWAKPIATFLDRMLTSMPDSSAGTPSRLKSELEAISLLLDDVARVPAEIAISVSAADAFKILFPPRRGERRLRPNSNGAIEVLGWLDLPLDDAPRVIVVGMNEGFVPSSASGDLFLPNALRTKLGIDDNARRYARDACALASLLTSRERVTLVVGRRDAEGNPLLPSRLLFAADPSEVPGRILRFFRKPEPRPVAAEKTPPPKTFLFRVPRPKKLEKPVEKLSVTSFRSFLACRYRWYLRNVLWLEGVDDRARELEAGPFGTLLHEALGGFGDSAARDATDADLIADALKEQLELSAAKLFGEHRPTAVRIQLDQIALRLKVFATRQAQRAREGWRIKYTETGLDREGRGRLAQPLVVDGLPITLTGRIDRIDQHADGRIAIFDYKSSEAGRSPDQAHRRQGSWVDLQLPLYRHLVKQLGLAGPCELGYITLPRDLTAGGFVLAGWSEAELAEADEVAASVVRDLRGEVFWPPMTPPPAFSEEFAAICQDTVFGRPVPGREEGP